MTEHFTLSPPRARRGTALDGELAVQRHRIDKTRCVHPDKGRGYVDGLYIEGDLIVAKLWSGGRFDPVRADRCELLDGGAA